MTTLQERVRAHFEESIAAKRQTVGAGAQMLDPALGAGGQPFMHAQRQPERAALLQPGGQALLQLINRKRLVHAQRSGHNLRTQADAVPDFALGVLGLAKQRAASYC